MSDLWIPVFLLAAILFAVLLSIPRGHTEQSETRHVHEVQDDTGVIARRAARLNEHAHQRNHAEMCRLASEMSRRPVLDYSDPPLLLTDGEVIDARVTEIRGLLP